MQQLIFPLVIIGIGLASLYLISKRKGKPQKSSTSQSKQTVQQLIGVKDIRDKYLYTADGYVLMYLQITPISIDLLTDREKMQKARQLTAEFSAEQNPFKIIAVSRPIDISPLVSEFSQMISSTSNRVRKELLKLEMMNMSDYVMSGEVVERQYYLIMWCPYQPDCEHELAKRILEAQRYFMSGGVQTKPLEQKEIIQLCNLINNPLYTHLEDTGMNNDVTMITGMFANTEQGGAL